MEYEIVAANHREFLESQVNRMIAEGWVPVGGVSVSVIEGDRKVWAQAMIRK